MLHFSKHNIDRLLFLHQNIIETYDHGHLVPDSSSLPHQSKHSWMTEFEQNRLVTDSGSRRATMADIVVAYATVPGRRNTPF